MTQASTDILIRIYPLNKAQGFYPVEAEIDDGSRFDDGQLHINVQELLQYELNPEAYGLALFQALFTGEILRAYERATTIADTESDGSLRVRLWVDEDALELHAVPWERLYHMHKGTPVPLSASALTPFSRYTSLETSEPEPITEEPLRMLLAVSNPENLPENMASVDVTGEIENILNSLKGLIRKKTLAVSVMPGISGIPEPLRREMTRLGVKVVDGPVNLFTISPQLINTHIFHFIGHGGYRRRGGQDGQVAIYLEKPDGSFQASLDDEVVSMFTALGRPPHCVFLQSCETAQRETDATDPFVGLGPKLVRAGIPALVAMQRQVPMDLARLFAGEFYTRLTEHGEVDRALNQARLVAFNKKYADWSIPLLFMRIRSGRLFGEDKEPLTERVTRIWPIAVSLTAIAVVLGVILWFVIPRGPTEMTKQFNVAVAEFIVQDSNGKRIRDDGGRKIGEYLEQQIGAQFRGIELDSTIPYEVWGPKLTKTIEGDTVEERSDTAEKRAKEISAHIMIYGVIVVDGENSRFAPEFYINHSSFKEASEITGQHELGKQLPLGWPFDATIQPIENQALAGRVRALDLITIGLAYYSIDDFENALGYFEQAALEERWVGSGREVLYLLIGNVHVREASKIQDFSTLSLATENYMTALEQNSSYGRAMIGQANIYYLEASLDKENCDVSKFEHASDLLEQALDLPDQPSSANIEAKVHFYRGQIAIIQDACNLIDEDWLTVAENEFTWVTSDYEARKQNNLEFAGIESFASHAYIRLGYIAYQRGDAQGGISWFKKGIPISSPFYRGEYTALLGDIYIAINEKALALKAYQDAIAIAEANGDGERVSEYQRKLESAQNQ